MQHLRVGVAGAGYWGQNLIRNCAELGILHSICDPNESALASIADTHAGVITTRSFEELLAGDIDAVLIATPAQMHASMCLDAIAAGKHVFVEKPLALSVPDGERVAQAAEKGGRILLVGHVLLYHPAVRKLQALLAEEVIGTVWHLRSRRLSLGKLRNHENVWWSFAPHDVALMLAIMGEPTFANASQTVSSLPDLCDIAYADFHFSSGRSAHIEVCWLDPEKTARLDVFGTRGVITLRDARGESALTVTTFDISSHSSSGRSISRKGQEEVVIEPCEPLRQEIEAFVEAIESGKQPLTSAQQGVGVLRALAMADAASVRSLGTRAIA